MPRLSKTDDVPIARLPKSASARKAGRPSNAMAGDVEARILDAATAMFLQHGYGGASLERIADAAGAGKATLYSRYAGKEALFSAVVQRNCERSLGLIFAAPPSKTLPEQLIAVTQTIGTRLVGEEVLPLIRMVIADAPRFPALAKLTSEQGRMRSIEAVTQLIAEFSGRTLDARKRAAAMRQARALATQILDAVVSPLLLRALLGESAADISRDIEPHVNQTIARFVNAKALDEFV